MALRLSIAVTPEHVGGRIDVFLTGYCSSAEGQLTAARGLTRARLQRLIVAGCVQLRGCIVTRTSVRVQPGDVIELELPDPEPTHLIAEPMTLEVLFEDSDIIVIAKPAGLTVHPGAGNRTGTLVHGLLAHCRDLSGIGGAIRPGIVHRLDKGTTGVMVVAKNDPAHAALAKQFASREVQKTYLAIVWGAPTPSRGTIDTRHGRHPTQRQRFTTHVAEGRRAITAYDTVRSAAGLSLLRVALHTGRTHQIRVHFAESGWPLVGDPVYGHKRLPRLSDADLQAVATEWRRQALHAWRLRFSHPTLGTVLSLEAPLPPDFAELVRRIEALG